MRQTHNNVYLNQQLSHNLLIFTCFFILMRFTGEHYYNKHIEHSTKQQQQQQPMIIIFSNVWHLM